MLKFVYNLFITIKVLYICSVQKNSTKFLNILNVKQKETCFPIVLFGIGNDLKQ